MLIINDLFTRKKPIGDRFYVSILKLFLLLSVIVTFLFLNLLAAETNPAKTITLIEAIQRTFNNDPELKTFHYQLEAQEGRRLQASLSPRPEVNLIIEDALGSGDLNGFDNSQATLSVGWILDKNIKNRRVQVASQGKKLIENEKIIQQLDSATKTARYFLVTLSYQEKAMIASRAIKLAESTVKEVNKRIKVGKTPLAELYRAEAQLAKRRLVLEDINHELESSIRQLASQWGSTDPNFNSVSGELINHPNVMSFNGLKNQLKNNPNIAKYLSVERINEAQLKLAKEERNPQWKFTTGLRSYQRTGDVGIVAGISIPFGGSNRNQGRIAEVRAKLSQNQAEADVLRLHIETSLFIVYQQLEHSIHLSDSLKIDIIPKLEKALTETHKAYELGKYSYLEWLAVQNELLDAQLALLDASLSTHLRKLELERLTGAQITSPF